MNHILQFVYQILALNFSAPWQRIALTGLISVVLASCGAGSDSSVSGLPAEKTVAASAFVGSATYEGASAAIGVVELTKISETRIGRTTFDYVFKVTVLNTGGDAEGVTLNLSQAGEGASVVDGFVSVGPIPSGTSVVASDTVTIRQDRSRAFNAQSLVWSVGFSAGTVKQVQSAIVDGGTIALPGEIDVVMSGQAGLAGQAAAVRVAKSPTLDAVLDMDASSFEVLSRDSRSFEIQVGLQPSEPGVPVSIAVPGYTQAMWDAGQVPVVFILGTPSSDDDGDLGYRSVYSETDIPNAQVAALVPPSAFELQANGVFVARVRVAIVQSAPTVAAVVNKAISTTPGVVVEKAGSTTATTLTPVRCPVKGSACTEISMFGPRLRKENNGNISSGKPHEGIDLRGTAGTEIYGVPGAKVLSFRTEEITNALFAAGAEPPAGAYVSLKAGRVTYKYMHLGKLEVGVKNCIGAPGYTFDTKISAYVYTGPGEPTCEFSPTENAPTIGVVGGTGLARGKPHLHFEILTNVPNGACSKGKASCAIIVIKSDPFPAILNKLVFTPSTFPPASIRVGDPINFAVTGQDISSNPVTVNSAISDDSSYPKGNQRFLCATDSEQRFTFAANDYGLKQRAPNEGSWPAPLAVPDAKCLLWGPSFTGFTAAATSSGSTTLTVSYTDALTALSEIPSTPNATTTLAITTEDFRFEIVEHVPPFDSNSRLACTPFVNQTFLVHGALASFDICTSPIDIRIRCVGSACAGDRFRVAISKSTLESRDTCYFGSRCQSRTIVQDNFAISASESQSFVEGSPWWFGLSSSAWTKPWRSISQISPLTNGNSIITNFSWTRPPAFDVDAKFVDRQSLSLIFNIYDRQQSRYTSIPFVSVVP